MRGRGHKMFRTNSIRGVDFQFAFYVSIVSCVVALSQICPNCVLAEEPVRALIEPLDRRFQEASFWRLFVWQSIIESLG